MQSKKINIVTLGCAKNIVDSEHLAGQLLGGKNNGDKGKNSDKTVAWKVIYDSDSIEAKVVVINTCGFIGDAKEESINTILRFAAARKAGDIDHLFVMGCLSERYRDELREEIPEVDQFFGVNDLGEILRTVGAAYRDELQGERLLTTPPHYAYLKISEGCNWGCGYCAIPLIRGRHVSVPMEQLLTEAEGLVAKGVKELIVIAQDTTYYGLDLYGQRRLGELLRALCHIEGVEWVRLHYAYPAQFPDDVIEALRDEPKLCKYLDLPLQHISERILRSMRRGLGKAETLELIDRLRHEIPDIALRTTLLVGYPGETEADFSELLDFVRTAHFDRLGVFPYSEEEGTYSACELSDDIPAEIKEQRVERIMELQREIAHGQNERLVGTLQKIVIDRREGEYWVGRTQYDSPEVDQEVLIPASALLQPGDWVTGRITAADDYDLYAEIAV